MRKSRAYSFGEGVASTLTACFMITLIALTFAWPVVFLWGAFAPSIFGLPDMTYWQGFAFLAFLLLLVGLFKEL